MQVFKAYFKIIKKQLGQISIYVGIFLALAVMVTLSSPVKDIGEFTQSKTRVAFLNEDENSVLIQGFKEFLGNQAVYVPVENETDKLQDALFFRDVEYIAKIPKGFSRDFMESRSGQIEKTVVPGSTSSIYTDMLVSKYFNTARLYLNHNKGITQEELVKQVAGDLKIETKVEMKKTDTSGTSNGNAGFYYNFLAYVMICILILGVSSIMMVFNNKNLRRRNLCAPIKNTSVNMQILLGNILYATACWAVMVICSLVLYGNQMLTINSAFLCLNSYVFTLTALSLSFLVGISIKSGNAQSAAANVMGLGLSFISGVFVPQELLGRNVLAMARFTPTYWYVKANNVISSLTNFSAENLSPVFTSMLIQLGFAVALLSVALAVSKRKQLRGS